MFGPIPHTTLIGKLLKFLNNLRNILQIDISNGIHWLFLFLWPYNVLDTQRDNQHLSWSYQIIFWLWGNDFHLVHNTKIHIDVQVDVLLTIMNLPVFPNIVMTTNFHVCRCERFFLEHLMSGETMINRRWCYNC